jgi:hypothetical protein
MRIFEFSEEPRRKQAKVRTMHIYAELPKASFFLKIVPNQNRESLIFSLFFSSFRSLYDLERGSPVTSELQSPNKATPKSAGGALREAYLLFKPLRLTATKLGGRS